MKQIIINRAKLLGSVRMAKAKDMFLISCTWIDSLGKLPKSCFCICHESAAKVSRDMGTVAFNTLCSKEKQKLAE